jgi:hypothetical protein
MRPLRMRLREIETSDVEAVLAVPQKVTAGDDGATNYYGVGPSGFRARVTVAADGFTIETVAWADQRKEKGN